MKKADKLVATIEATLADLLSDKSTLTNEQKEEKRKDVLLAIKWQAVKIKIEDGDWGKGLEGDE